MQTLKPSFLIIGAAKAATTALSSMLDRHPEAGIIEGKEPHFFSIDTFYARGWAWYQSGFRRCLHKRVLGDASTSYSRIRYHPHTVPRILRHVPEVRIIYMVRHPLRRIESAYLERMASIDAAKAYPSINHAVRAEPMMTDSSRYWEVFDYYRRHFGEDRIKIVWFEEFTRDKATVFSEVCQFLGIDSSISVELDRRQTNSRTQVLENIRSEHAGQLPRIDMEWDDATRQWVEQQLGDDNRRFLRYFGRPEDYWS